MRIDPEFDSDRRWRRLRLAGALAVATLSVGSCAGFAMARYTVTGMNPFYLQQRPPALAAAPQREESAWFDDWPAPVDASAEVADARLDDRATY